MANIVLTDQIFYKNGQGGVSGVVGYESKSNRVVRYTLQSPPSGASGIDLNFTGNYWTEYGVLPETLFFYIGKDPESHANAGKDFEKTGVLERKAKTYDYSGSAEILLMPNTTYYVWVFPASTAFGWLYWSKSIGDATVETTGGAVSVVAPVSVVLGNEAEIFVTKHIESYTHTIRFELANAVGLICEKSAETKLLWTPPVDLAWQITNSDRANATIIVETYNGDELVGTTSDTQFELIVPESIVPSVSFSWKDMSVASEKFDALAQGVSFLAVDVSADGNYGSRIEKNEIILGNEQYNGGVLDRFGDLTLTVNVIDSRGRSASSSQNLYVFEYSSPSISISASRCNLDGTANETGEYATVTIKTVTHQVNDKNEASVLLNYGGNSETVSVVVGEKQTTKIIPAPSVAPLAISAVVYDKIKESPIAKMVLSIGYATLDFLSGGRGIAFGTTATKPGFTCAMDTDFSNRQVTGVRNPQEKRDAANKQYVDVEAEKLKKYVDNKTHEAPELSPISVSANAPLSVQMQQGDMAHISFITSKTTNGDIFLLVNGRGPDNSGYSFAGQGSNFTGGQIGFSGSSFAAVVKAEAQFHGSDLIVTGKDIRGNNTGVGTSFLVWRDLGKVESITFSAPGTILAAGILLKAVKTGAAGLAVQITDGVLVLAGGINAYVENNALKVSGNIQATVENDVLIVKEAN